MQGPISALASCLKRLLAPQHPGKPPSPPPCNWPLRAVPPATSPAERACHRGVQKLHLTCQESSRHFIVSTMHRPRSRGGAVGAPRDPLLPSNEGARGDQPPSGADEALADLLVCPAAS